MKCCICKKELKEIGHNPRPVKQSGRCCSKCNKLKVIPARLKIAIGARW